MLCSLLCCAVLCYAVLWCAVLCCAWCAVLCCVVILCAVSSNDCAYLAVFCAAFGEDDIEPITDSDCEVRPSAASDAITDSDVEVGTSEPSSQVWKEAQAVAQQISQAPSSEQLNLQLDAQGQELQARRRRSAQQLSTQAQSSEPSSLQQAEAAASEQQAAADMSSMGQQGAEQLDPEEAARVSPEQNLSTGVTAMPSIGQQQTQAVSSVQQSESSTPPAEPAGPSLTAYGQKKGRPKTANAAPKTRKQPGRGRPKKPVE